MKQPGKRARLYIGEEDSFGTPPTITAVHAMRHISAQLDYDPTNKVFFPEKKAGPGRYARATRRATAGCTVEGLLRPSGTINTLPECSMILKNAFGSVVNTALSTTVASGGALTGAVLTSATGLAAGSVVRVTCPDGKIRARIIVSVATNTVVWWPEMPSGQVPANGAVVKAGTSYKLTAAHANTLFAARYIPEADFTAGLNEIVKGWKADRLSLTLSNIDEVKFSCGGPAQIRADAPSDPATFTQVGTNPPSAMTGEAYVNNTLINLMTLGIEMTNGIEMRNDEIGESGPTEAYRMGDRDLSVSMDMAVENEFKAAVYDMAVAGTDVSLFMQVGMTEGKIIVVGMRRVEFKAPTTDVPDDAAKWPLRGLALEYVEDANDEIILGVL